MVKEPFRVVIAEKAFSMARKFPIGLPAGCKGHTLTLMAFPRSPSYSLPVVKSSPGPRLPGASHAAAPDAPAAPRHRGQGRAAIAALLCFGGLSAAVYRHSAPPISPAAVLTEAAAVPAAALVAAPRWDTDLNAVPNKGQFVRFYRMKVTAYTPINTRMEGGRYTSTLRDGRAEHGVAVDPDLIPLGSHLWIPGYGHAIADDIGGAIQGHHVDLRMQRYGNMGVWGVRPVRIYVLDEPPGK